MNWNQRKGKLPLERYIVSCLAALSICCGAWATEPAASPREQLKQLTAKLQQSPNDRSLRENIIRLALALKPAPAVPDEAAEAEGAAEFAFNNAKSKSDYATAAKEYEKALLAAPWVAADYFNLGVALEKAEDFAGARRGFELYLLAAPGAQDTLAVRKRIGALKFAADKATKDASPATRVERVPAGLNLNSGLDGVSFWRHVMMMDDGSSQSDLFIRFHGDAVTFSIIDTRENGYEVPSEERKERIIDWGSFVGNTIYWQERNNSKHSCTLSDDRNTIIWRMSDVTDIYRRL